MEKMGKTLTVLHVEDDPTLIKLVQAAFEDFGFTGEIVAARSVREASELLAARARNREVVDLILVDMQLPDGTGLDLIRETKSDPCWCEVPVVVLSDQTTAGIINGAYALGANCYMPKNPRRGDAFDGLQTLYKLWLEYALLPKRPADAYLGDVLRKGVTLRARTSRLYMELARAFNGNSEETGFWLDRSLNEGNLSNLLAFFGDRPCENVSAETIQRLTDMQSRIGASLAMAEGCLRDEPPPSTDKAYRWALSFTSTLDEEALAEVLGCLFPKAPVATIALKARAAAQLEALGGHILQRSQVPELCGRAQTLLAWAQRLKTTIA